MFVIRKQLFLFQSAQNDGLERRTQDVTPEMAITMYRGAAEPEQQLAEEIEAHPPLLRCRERERLMIHLIFSRALFR
jgi:hypothetical protein